MGGRSNGGRVLGKRLLLGFALVVAGQAQAGELFKCGNSFQDRPCESADVQQRFSRTQGSFVIQQVNPNTDRDCAKIAADAMVWRDRMAKGESLESLQAEVQARKISRYDKSMLRDVLTAISTYKGSSTEVRSQFETQCMAYKRRHGYPTERETAAAESRGAAIRSGAMAEAELRRAQADAQRAEAEVYRTQAADRAAALAAARRAQIEARRAQLEAQSR